MIREATENDLLAIVEMGEMFYDTTPYAQIIPYDMQSAKITALQVMSDETGLVLVCEVDGEVVGIISGILVPAYWNLGSMIAQQLTYYVKPGSRSRESLRLLDAWEAWAKEKGAVMVSSGAKKNHRFNVMHRLLSIRGYVEVESHHIMKVK